MIKRSVECVGGPAANHHRSVTDVDEKVTNID